MLPAVAESISFCCAWTGLFTFLLNLKQYKQSKTVYDNRVVALIFYEYLHIIKHRFKAYLLIREILEVKKLDKIDFNNKNNK